jgi:hypothetical protein
MTNQERKQKIIARGEHSNHAHIIVGDAKVSKNAKGEIIIEVGNEGAVLRHLLESEWLNDKEIWTEEHQDINLSGLPNLVRHGDVALERIEDRKYRFIQQQVFDPLTQRIEDARD